MPLASIRDHYTSVLRRIPIADVRPDVPRAHELSDYSVVRLPPDANRREWFHGTQGMTEPRSRDPLELHTWTLQDSPNIAKVLHAVAHFHRSTPLSLGHTVRIGDPWIPGSECDCGLISLPYLDGPAIEWFQPSNSSPRTRCLWLIPISERERKFKIGHGLEELEQRLEASGFNYADLLRSSVV